MAVTRAMLPASRRAAAALVVLLLGAAPAAAQQAPDPTAPTAPSSALGAAPAPFKPDAGEMQPDVWIFSGELQNSHETFSGTLVAAGGAKGGGTVQFELKLAGGASCDGSDVSGEVGLVRLGEITCSDDRVMRALFVPQGGETLKVFGHIGDERFMANAHLLGTEAAPEKKQTAQPTAPQIQGPETQGPAAVKPEGVAPDAAPPR